MKSKKDLKEKNKVIIASAGSGKTTALVRNAISVSAGKVLITTYTQANEAEIRKKIVAVNKCIPSNITIQTWFSFLLQHGVRPYQGALDLHDKNIKGLLLVNEPSGVKFKIGNRPVFYAEDGEFDRHYFSSAQKIFSDKISKFVCRANEKSDGRIIKRLSEIYSFVFIDEVQDLAGYDLEFLKLLFKSEMNVLLVGDPRQATYSTNSSTKNKNFKKAAIAHFFEKEKKLLQIDDCSMTTNYRCNAAICNLSNRLFPDLKSAASGNQNSTGHDGVFFVKEKDIEAYLETFRPVQLRDSKRRTVHRGYDVMNFGDSKGLSFNRVLIYPTKPFIKWLSNDKSQLADVSRSKLYVALTRARFSVAIVHDYKAQTSLNGIENFTICADSKGSISP